MGHVSRFVPLTDEQIMSAACNAADALDATRVNEMKNGAWHPTTIFDGDSGLLRFGRLIEQALNAAASEKQTNTPEGWKLVPVEATNEMQWAANDYSTATESKPKGMWWWNRLYQAMLAAAPEAPK
jgi:hypothetical protein